MTTQIYDTIAQCHSLSEDKTESHPYLIEMAGDFDGTVRAFADYDFVYYFCNGNMRFNTVKCLLEPFGWKQHRAVTYINIPFVDVDAYLERGSVYIGELSTDEDFAELIHRFQDRFAAEQEQQNIAPMPKVGAKRPNPFAEPDFVVADSSSEESEDELCSLLCSKRYRF